MASFSEEDAPYEIVEPEASTEGSTGLDRVAGIIKEFEEVLVGRRAHHLGYPYNLDFDFTKLESISKYSINNLGDPFVPSNYGIHSRKFEVGVLNWFAKLWEIDRKDM